MNVLSNGYNPFADLENPEIKKQKEEKDKNYNSKQISPKEFEKSKQEAGKIFGKDFNPNYKENLPKEKKEDIPEDPFELINGNNNLTKLNEKGKGKSEFKTENLNKKASNIKQIENKVENKNNINYPIIKALHSNNKISNNTYIEILEILENTKNKKFKDIINGLKIKNPEEKKELNRIINDNNPEKNTENFKKILKENNIDGLNNLKDIVNNKSNNTIYQEVYNLIGSNFIQIDKNNPNPKKDISIAIETAGNHVIEKYPSIKKMSDTQMYKNAFKDIKANNIKKGIEGIKNLLLLGSTLAYAGGKINKLQSKKAKGIIEGKYKERIKKIDIQIKQLTIEKKEKQNNRQLNLKIEQLEKEKKEITSGEIFSKAGKIDKNSQKKEKKE